MPAVWNLDRARELDPKEKEEKLAESKKVAAYRESLQEGAKTERQKGEKGAERERLRQGKEAKLAIEIQAEHSKRPLSKDRR